MTNKLHLKKRIIKASILLTVMFTHTGCFFGYFDNPLVPIEKPKQNRITIEEPIQSTIVRENPIEHTIVRETTKQNRIVKERSRQNTIVRNTSKKNITLKSSAPVSVIFNNPTPIVEECTDDDSSNCTKPPIKANEVKPKIETSTGGEVHKLKSIKGERITVIERPTGFLFPEHEDKVVILEMFGKNCSHCIREIPTLNRLRRNYRGKVKIVAVQVEDRMGASEAKHFIRRHKIRYPIIAGETATNLQYNIQNTYGWTGILPFTMIIKNGITEFTYPGAVSYNEINKDLRSIVN